MAIVMGRNAQPQACRADGAEIGGLQIFLPQMDAIRLMLNRQPRGRPAAGRFDP